MWALIAFVGLPLALVEAFLLYRAVVNTRRSRLIARLPWTELGQMQPGLVKVAGKVVPTDGQFRSPLLDQDCVYFRFIVQEKRQRGGTPHSAGGAYWKTVIDDAQFLPFALDDGTGRIMLHLHGAEMVLDPGEEERSGFLNDARPELEQMLREDYNYSSIGLMFNRTLWYNENRIEESDTLVVVGTAEQIGAGTWELRAGPLLVSNLGEAGLRSSYRNAAIGWWIAAIVAGGAVGALLTVISHGI